MKKYLKLLLALLLSLVYSHSASAESYTMNVGETLDIRCTATAPAGYITHAFFYCQNPSDEEYLDFDNETPRELKTTAYGFRAKANIPVTVQYAYTYTGSYDHKTHVGSGEYTIYVTVKGGGAATGIKFSPEGDIKMKVGETRKIDIELIPANAISGVTWGRIDALGNPLSFEITGTARTIEVYAKKKGKLYLAAQTSNGKTAACVVIAEEDNPTAVSIPKTLDVYVGETTPIDVKLTPADAATTFSWTIGDKSLLSISKQTITGKAEGVTTISCTTGNKLVSNECQVRVMYHEATDVKITDETLRMSIEDSPKQLKYNIYPTNAKNEVQWKVTSGQNVVSVNETGVVTPLRAGEATVTVTTNNGLTDACKVTVYEPEFKFVSSNPQNGATDVPSNVQPTVTFSLGIEKSSNFSKIELRDLSTNKSVEGTVSLNGKELVFQPKKVLESKTRYKLYVPSGSVQNKWGTPLPTAVEISFESKKWEKLTLKTSTTDKFLTRGEKIILTASNPAAKIYYTINGKTPTAGSTLYDGSIIFNGDIRLRAIAMAEGFENSDVLAMDYCVTNVEVKSRYPDTDAELYIYEDVNPSITFTNRIRPSDAIEKVTVKKNGTLAIDGEIIVADSTIYFVPDEPLELGCSYKFSVPDDAIVTVQGEPNIATSWTFYTGDFATHLDASREIAAAIKSDGSLWTWGNLYKSGNTADGSYTMAKQSVPQRFINSDIKAVSTGFMHNAVIKTDGTLWMWGRQYCGEFGNNSTTGAASPVQVMENVKDVSCGGQTTAIVKSDGTLWMVGRNDFGQLGDNSTITKKSPVKILTNVAQATAGWCSSFAVTTDGTLYAWGRNNQRQLGDGTSEDSSSPKKIMDDIALVAAPTETMAVAAAIKTDGTLWLWGEGNDTPVKVTDEASCVTVGSGGVEVIKEDGSLWHYALGGVTWVADRIANVAQANDGEVVLRSDGSVWSVGNNGLRDELIDGRNSSTLAGIFLNCREMRLPEGAHTIVAAKPIALNADYATMSWESSNENVASVTERGVIDALGIGEADITVRIADDTGKKYYATCHVTVCDAAGIDEITAEASVFRAWCNRSTLYLRDLIPGSEVVVYNSEGAMIDRFNAEQSEMSRPLPLPGVYVVSSNGITRKILNK